MNEAYENTNEIYEDLTEQEIQDRLFDFLADPSPIEKAKFLIALTEDDQALNAIWLLVVGNMSRYGVPDDYATRELVKAAEGVGKDMIEGGEI